MGSLSLVKDSSGNIVGASIAGNKIDGFVGATQSLAGGELRAVLTVNFIKRECKDEIKPTNESYGKSWIFNFKGDNILEFTTAPILNF